VGLVSDVGALALTDRRGAVLYAKPGVLPGPMHG
jgi:hypothetical protein